MLSSITPTQTRPQFQTKTMVTQEDGSKIPPSRISSSFITTTQIILRSMICALDIYLLIISIVLSTRKVNFAVAYFASIFSFAISLDELLHHLQTANITSTNFAPPIPGSGIVAEVIIQVVWAGTIVIVVALDGHKIAAGEKGYSPKWGVLYEGDLERRRVWKGLLVLGICGVWLLHFVFLIWSCATESIFEKPTVTIDETKLEEEE